MNRHTQRIHFTFAIAAGAGLMAACGSNVQLGSQDQSGGGAGPRRRNKHWRHRAHRRNHRGRRCHTKRRNHASCSGGSGGLGSTGGSPNTGGTKPAGGSTGSGGATRAGGTTALGGATGDGRLHGHRWSHRNRRRGERRGLGHRRAPTMEGSALRPWHASARRIRTARSCRSSLLRRGQRTRNSEGPGKCVFGGFALPPGACSGLACPTYFGYVTDTGKTTPFEGTTVQPIDLVSVGCVGHLCTTDVVLPPADAGQDVGPSVDASSPAALCTATGGQVVSTLCCTSVTDFPSSCLVGACGCAPSNSHTVSTCTCATGCFAPGYGCVTCTVGADQTCN